jgi:hypothetical protein
VQLLLTCSEVYDKIKKEESVGDAVEDDPPRAEVVIEERDCNRKNDEVGHQRDQHKKVPVKSAKFAAQNCYYQGQIPVSVSFVIGPVALDSSRRP